MYAYELFRSNTLLKSNRLFPTDTVEYNTT